MKKLTIIALVVAITAVFAVTAMANEWNLYGSARMATYYTSQDLGKTLEATDDPTVFISVKDRNVANQDTVSNTAVEPAGQLPRRRHRQRRPDRRALRVLRYLGWWWRKRRRPPALRRLEVHRGLGAQGR